MVLIRREKSRGLAIRPLTQTAPDGKSEAEQNASLRKKPQVSAVTRCAPGRIRTCDTRFRRAVLYPLSYEGGASAKPCAHLADESRPGLLIKP